MVPDAEREEGNQAKGIHTSINQPDLVDKRGGGPLKQTKLGWCECTFVVLQNRSSSKLPTQRMHQKNFYSSILFTEYAQPLVSGVPTLGARSTFKPDEGPEPGYSDPDLYDAPIPPDVYHPYAEPLPSSGAEYATPIVVDMGCHLPSKVLNFMGSGPSSLLTWTDSSHSGGSVYDTPKNANGQTMPTQDLTYQVPQKVPPKPAG